MKKIISSLSCLALLANVSAVFAMDKPTPTTYLFNATPNTIEVNYLVYEINLGSSGERKIMDKQTVQITAKNSPVNVAEIKLPLPADKDFDVTSIVVTSVVERDNQGAIVSKRNFGDTSNCITRGEEFANVDLVFDDIGSAKIVCQKSLSGSDTADNNTKN